MNPAATTPLSLTQQSAAARAAYPELIIAGMRPAATDLDSTRVYFANPSLGEDTQRAVFVDPYSGEVLGASRCGSATCRSVRGSTGSTVTCNWASRGASTASSRLPGCGSSPSPGGLVDREIPTDRRRGRILVAVDRSLRGRARSLNWHGATGVWILLGASVLVRDRNHLVHHAGAHVSDLRAAMQWQRPQLDTDLTGAGADGHSARRARHGDTPGTADVAAIDFDAVVASAAAGGVQAPIEIALPSEAGHAVAVAEIDKPYRLTTDAARSTRCRYR